MGPPVGRPHRHRGEEVDDASVFVIGARRRASQSQQRALCAWARSDLCPSPQASSKKKREPAPRFANSLRSEDGSSKHFVLLGHGTQRASFRDDVASHCG
jgi:hypothetical protein